MRDVSAWICEQEQGVTAATVSYGSGRARVDFDPERTSVDQIARRAGLSRRSFQRKLWKECHFTFSQLFQEVRMALARRYLSSTRRSIEEVSDMLGYANVSSFSRSFRKLAGMTPSAFRNENIDKGIDYLEPIGPL